MGPGERAGDLASAPPSSSSSSSSAAQVPDPPKEPLAADLAPLCRKDMDRLVMNYLQTEGFRDAAEHFKVEADIPMCPKIGSMDERIEIRNSIKSGLVTDAKERVNNLHPELLDENYKLHFRLIQQELIEMIRTGDVEKCLEFAQTHLSEIGEDHPELLPEIENAMALLAFDNPEKTPFGDLMQPAHREKVASEVNTAVLEFENQCDSAPKISLLLKTILWLQSELDARKFKYPKLLRFVDGDVEVLPQNNESL